MTKPRSHRLMHLADLTERHHGRMVELGDITGQLVGTIPCGNRVQLALIVGGAHMWTDAMDSATTVDVWRAEG